MSIVNLCWAFCLILGIFEITFVRSVIVVRALSATTITICGTVAKGSGVAETAAAIVLAQQIRFLTEIRDATSSSRFASGHLLAARLFDEFGGDFVKQTLDVVCLFGGSLQKVHALLFGEFLPNGNRDLTIVAIRFVA